MSGRIVKRDAAIYGIQSFQYKFDEGNEGGRVSGVNIVRAAPSPLIKEAFYPDLETGARRTCLIAYTTSCPDRKCRGGVSKRAEQTDMIDEALQEMGP